jgi:uncharacterized membrane protein YedE/YeeE
MTEFTPWSALAGGTLIGLASAVLLLASGRTAGISGITAGLLRPWHGEGIWRWMFIAGLILGTVLYGLFGGNLAAVQIDANTATLTGGGLLVGIGTRLGGGCTSGHGVCGISRLSVRSITATLIFMTTAAAVVFVTRHVLGGGA